MANANLTWTACGPTSEGQLVYYGKTVFVTGVPPSGTGYVLHTGGPVSNTATSAVIPIDDNVEYIFYIICDCIGGDGPFTSQGPIINYVCPNFSSVNASFDSISFIASVPSSANNSGSWIQKIIVELKDQSDTTVIQSKTYTAPFASSYSDSFTGLVPNTQYRIKIRYADASDLRRNQCVNQLVTTTQSCTIPTLTITNVTSSSFDVGYSPIYSGDTFTIEVNGNIIATGLTNSPYTVTGLTSNTNYNVEVTRYCASGGSAAAVTNASTTSSYNLRSNSTLGTTTFNFTGVAGISTVGPIAVAQPTFTGNHLAFTGPIAYTWTGTPPLAGHVTLYRNGVVLQCKVIPVQNGGSGNFDSFSYTATDYIEIYVSTGNCI